MENFGIAPQVWISSVPRRHGYRMDKMDTMDQMDNKT